MYISSDSLAVKEFIKVFAVSSALSVYPDLHFSLCCFQKLLDVFKEYAFLWQQDVNQTFEEFLSGLLTPNPLRSATAARTEKQAPPLPIQTDRSSQASRCVQL